MVEMMVVKKVSIRVAEMVLRKAGKKV